MSFVESLEFSRLYEGGGSGGDTDAGLAIPMVDDNSQSLWQGSETGFGRHQLRHQRGHRRADRARGGAVKVFAPPPASRDDVTPHLLSCQAQKQAGAGNSRASRKLRSRMDIQPAGRGVRKLIERINANLNNHGLPRRLARVPPAFGWQTRSLR